jgi:hypothetical protein
MSAWTRVPAATRVEHAVSLQNAADPHETRNLAATAPGDSALQEFRRLPAAIDG